MQQATSKRADILRTEEGITVFIGNLQIDVVLEPKQFSPLNPYEDEDGSPGLMLWEKEYVARKGDIVETGEGSLIARSEMNSWKAKDIKNALLSGDELEE